LGNLSLFVIINFLFIATILFIFGPRLFKIIGSGVDFYPYIAIGIAIGFFTILTVLPSALYRVREKPLPLTILNLVRGFAVLGFTILSVYVFEPTAVNVLWARFAATAIFGIIFLIITLKNAELNINIPQLKHALAFSLPLVPATLATYLYSMFDKILIEKYLSLTELGLYSTASTLAFLLNIISQGAYKAFEPQFFKTYGSPGFDTSFEKVRDLLLFVVLIGGMCISGFSDEFLRIFSDSGYERARFYVPVLTVGAIASAMYLMYSTIVTAREKTKISAVITIVGALLSIGLDIIFLRFWGIWAASAISVLSLLFLCYGNMFFSKVKIGHVKPVIGVLIAMVSMFIMTVFMHFESIFLSIVAKCLFISLITIVLVLFFKINLTSLVKSLIK
jgi:O-antigen/teichoic acid export membrane protein